VIEVNKHQQIILAVLVTSGLIGLLFIFDILNEYHFLVAQLFFVQIIIGVFLYKKFVIFSSGFLSLFHIIHDGIILSDFPVNAFFESLVQVIVYIILLKPLGLEPGNGI
jgi:hypothetical protein